MVREVVATAVVDEIRLVEEEKGRVVAGDNDISEDVVCEEVVATAACSISIGEVLMFVSEP